MLKAFSLTDIGRKRRTNQDYVYISKTPVGNLPNLFIVADGMGGHNAGDYASRMTVETILEELGTDSGTIPGLLLERAIATANYCVRRKAEENAALEGMGTTVVAATCIDGILYVANVGDSRLYIVNEKEIRQITRDHSLVEEMVRMGGLDRAAARNHPDKNIITRAVGVNETVEPEFFKVVLEKGDRILMCSDGLTNMLEDEEIKGLLMKQSADELAKAAEGLVKAANENGGRDNISVILIAPML